MWDNYDPDVQCPTTQTWYHGKDCCAIRLSYALKKSGVTFQSYLREKTTDGLTRSADGIRDWFITNMEGKPEIMSRNDFVNKYWNDPCATGVVWLDLPGNTNHVDLFNGGAKRPFRTFNARASFEQVYFWKVPEIAGITELKIGKE